MLAYFEAGAHNTDPISTNLSALLLHTHAYTCVILYFVTYL